MDPNDSPAQGGDVTFAQLTLSADAWNFGGTAQATLQGQSTEEDAEDWHTAGVTWVWSAGAAPSPPQTHTSGIATRDPARGYLGQRLTSTTPACDWDQIDDRANAVDG